MCAATVVGIMAGGVLGGIAAARAEATRGIPSLAPSQVVLWADGPPSPAWLWPVLSA